MGDVDESQNGYHGDATTNIDIGAMASSLEKRMPPADHGNISNSPKICIFKTPNILSRHKQEAYLPNAFSFGPLHHGQFPDTEEIKLKYLRDLLAGSHADLRDLIKAVAAIEGEARCCYAALPDFFSKERFTEMLLLDGCFLLVLFLKKSRVVEVAEDDPVLKVSIMGQFLWHDLVLLENQIPWLVLERLYCSISCNNIVTGNENHEHDHDDSLIEIITNFLCGAYGYLPCVKPIPRCRHILHLLREIYILSSEKGPHPDVQYEWVMFPTATSLVEAGVKINKGGSRSILDIQFDKVNGVLTIPPFGIHDVTEATFRNLISFEQCLVGCDPRITCYLILLDNLINTTKDLSILQESGIVTNCWLDPEEAVRIFNCMYHDTFVSKFYYTDVCKEVKEYCGRKWPRWRAMYVRNYFSTPWAIVSQVVAAVLLIFGFLQTFFPIKK